MRFDQSERPACDAGPGRAGCLDPTGTRLVELTLGFMLLLDTRGKKEPAHHPCPGEHDWARMSFEVSRYGLLDQRVCKNLISASGRCVAGIEQADGSVLWCTRSYDHEGEHENDRGERRTKPVRWAGDKGPYELLDAAFEVE